MNNKSIYGLSLIALSMSMGQVAVAVEQRPEGFIEGSTFSILNRNLYLNRDYRKGQSSPTGNGYSAEWAHGIIGRFEAGSTQGTVGFGID